MSQNSKERNLGIELLRIVSMFAIVVLHVLGYGGVFAKINEMGLGVNSFSLMYSTAWFLEILCFFGVTTFALISGYVGYDGNYRVTNVVYVWLQALFYTVIFSVIFVIIGIETISFDLVSKTLLPVTTGHYWYLTYYVPVFFLMPIVNHALKSMNALTSKIIAIALIVMFSIWPTIFTSDVFRVNGGYSVIWLLTAYYIGAFIKKTDCFSSISTRRMWIMFILAFVVTWSFKIVVDILAGQGGSRFVEYNSPTILMMSVALLVIFSRMKPANPKAVILIKVVSPLSFGVYLFNCNIHIWENVIKDRFLHFAEYPVWKMTLCTILSAMVIFLLGITMDAIRKLVFDLGNLKQKLNIINDYIFKSHDVV